MGTRSLVRIKEGKATILTIYRQYDGYPSGMGNDIKKILNDGNPQILNGFSNHSSPEFFNGMGCLGAFLVGKLKQKIGNVYVMSPKTTGEMVDYVYTLSEKNGEVYLKVTETYNDKTIYNNLLKFFDGLAVEEAQND